jgi:putative pyruvate formate lyase activating enzyme
MTAILKELHRQERRPTIVFNSNAYDRKSTIISMERMVDVWLPDLKYMDEALGRDYSDTPDYPQVATAAIQEMYRQKGANLRLSENGTAEFGLIVRHLVLPGEVENSKAVLRWIADNLSTAVHVSLMAQYSPTQPVRHHPRLSRPLHLQEYGEVVSELNRLGFYRGWIQELSSAGHYSPDFDSPDHPFDRD